MSNSTVLNVSKQNLNSSGVLTDDIDISDVVTVTWTSRQGGVAVITDTTSSPVFTSLLLSGFTANYVELSSDQSISVKLNSATTAFTCSGWLSLTGSFTKVEVQNSSGVTANVGYDFRAA